MRYPHRLLLAAAALVSLAACATEHRPADIMDPKFAQTIDIRPAPEVRYAIDRISPAVVRLDVVSQSFNRGAAVTERSTGSGVIFDAEGHILTNFHVAGRAKKTTDSAGKTRAMVDITLANLEHVKAELIGSDHWTDLALLKLDTDDLKRRNLKFDFATLGDSSEVTLGQPVMALGTPYGLTRTITAGIVSNTDRFIGEKSIEGYESGEFNNWIQVDAAINPGNSGGPLINLRGEVIGINTRAIIDGNSLAFAIPINVAKNIIHTILEKKKVNRSYVGITLQPMQDLEGFYELPAGGVLISSVDQDSPAALAQVKIQDILLAVNDTPVSARFPEEIASIRKLIADQPIGSSIKFTVRRGKAATAAQVDVTVTSDVLESVITDEKSNRVWGISVRDVTRAYLRDNHLPPLKGVLVTSTTSSFPAAGANIQPDDIIVSIAGEAVTNVEDFDAAVAKWARNPRAVPVYVRRDRNEIICSVEPRK